MRGCLVLMGVAALIVLGFHQRAAAQEVVSEGNCGIQATVQPAGSDLDRCGDGWGEQSICTELEVCLQGNACSMLDVCLPVSASASGSAAHAAWPQEWASLLAAR